MDDIIKLNFRGDDYFEPLNLDEMASTFLLNWEVEKMDELIREIYKTIGNENRISSINELIGDYYQKRYEMYLHYFVAVKHYEFIKKYGNIYGSYE